MNLPPCFSQMRGGNVFAEYITSYWSICVSGMSSFLSRLGAPGRGGEMWAPRRAHDLDQLVAGFSVAFVPALAAVPLAFFAPAVAFFPPLLKLFAKYSSAVRVFVACSL